MSKNPLHVISNDEPEAINETESWVTPRQSKKAEAQARFERLWLVAPEQFCSTKNCMERERLDRAMNLIEDFTSVEGAEAVDLGCGDGQFSIKLAEKGARVDAIDVASRAKSTLEEQERVTFHQEYVPHTALKDDHYDLVAALDLIAYLPPQEHRLFLSELSRIVKPKGLVICSTSLDIHSEDPLHTFASLTDTEFKAESWVISHHKLYLQLLDFFVAPNRFYKASKNKEYREQKLELREGLSRNWFRLNSCKLLGYFWSVGRFLTNPVASFLKRSKSFMLFLERVCQVVWSDRGITHAIWIGHRRPLVEETPLEQRPAERKHKKQVWE